MTVSGINLANIDRSTPPTENFYQFANGGWLAVNPIPREYSRWGAFEELNELSNSQLHAILEECLTDTTTADPNRLAVRILYATGMDEDACRENGITPLADVYAAIDRMQAFPDVVRLSARLRAQMGVGGALFAFYSLPDAKNSSWEVAVLSQSNALGIGDRDFYIRDDKASIREKYTAHVARMLSLAGADPTQVDAFMSLETKIAEVCMTKTERRDPLKTYNKFTGVDDLAERTDSADIPWNDFFDLLELPVESRQTIIVDNPSFFTTLARLLKETSIETWKTYMYYHVTKSMSEFLSPEVKEEHFAFFGTTMTGQPEMKPRWKRVLNAAINEKLEDCLGILYTKRHFTASAKQACLEMVNVLTDVLRMRIDEVDWMQEQTKAKAKHKLDHFRAMIGYPDKWDVEDIPELLKVITEEQSYCANIRACNVRMFGKIVERINKPVDGNRWEMPSTLVNAYFHPLKNVIVFPAAILQPPFFFHPTPDAPYGDPAVNFSAIGAVICHEISHGYDDQGRKFDAKGELSDWWTEEDAAEYERRASNMVKLCDEYKIFGKNLNGKLCLGENIADYGGVKLSFRGLQEFMKKHGRIEDVDGFTAEQRFFLGWASVWRNNIREENALQRIIMDPHAPGEFRANIVQVIEEFHQAFGVKEGDKMWQGVESRCEIW